MKKKSVLIIFIVFVLLFMVIFPTRILASNRSVTIIAPSQATVGEKFTVTLGFDPKALTGNFDFVLNYDSSVIKFTGLATNATGLKEYTIHVYAPSSGTVRAGGTIQGYAEYMVDRAISFQFEAVKTGTAMFSIKDAADGIIENTINHSATKTVTLTDKPLTTTTTTTAPTTTRTTTTKPTTTRTTTSRTTTTKTTTPTSTTSTVTSSTSPSTPTSTIDPETVFTAKRYDGAMLTIPETVPSEQSIPESFEAVDINHLGVEMTAYRSSTLPYTLFWLADDRGEERFYYYDEETTFYIPFFRSEWSSRFFTFAVLSENQLPEGFELKTVEIRGQTVPAYTPSKGFYITQKSFQDLMLKVRGDTPLPDWKNYEGEPDPSESTTPQDTSLPIQSESSTSTTSSDESALTDVSNPAESRSVSQGSNSLTWQGVSIKVPEDLNLVALRMNDSDKKALYFYDRTLDSLIRADLWIIPLAGSFLSPHAPIVTETPPVSTAPTEPSDPSDKHASMDDKGNISLFGFTAPLWLWAGMGLALIALLVVIVWFILRARKAKAYDPDFDMVDEDEKDALWDDRDIDIDHGFSSREETWKRLGIVDMTSTESSPKERQAVPADGENVVIENAFDQSEPLVVEGEIDRQVTADSVDVNVASQLDSEWASLEKVVESASERRRRKQTGDDDLADDYQEDKNKSADSEEGSVSRLSLENDISVIQPGMNRPLPKRRVSKKRLLGLGKTTRDDDPLDKDEL